MDYLEPEDEVNTQDVGGNPKAEQKFDANDSTESKSLASTEDDEDSQAGNVGRRSVYLQIPYGFQSKGSYRHASKNCEIVGVTHNSRFRQFVFLDSRGITSWSYESVYSTVTRYLNYPAYQFNVLRLLIFSRKFNVYFALSKEYALKVFNLNFHEVFSVAAEMHSVLCMVFNHSNDELITGGTGGMKFWTFGEIDTDRQKAWERDSRPMANYGLVLRASYPHMGGSWVKQVELDEAMQRLYCLSERNVVAYDMEGNLLFQILDAHRGPVTGCVYSKAADFLVTVGNDCDINVWSRSKSGGKVHTFTGHSKAITKIMLHPESSALIITAAMDGSVKVHSLDIMEELYSLPVFSEGIFWMDCVSTKFIYCCSNRVIEVFSLNHLTDFWALTRCSVTSLSLVTCNGKSSRVMAVGNDSSVRLISRKRKNLSTVLPPPPISPLNMVKDVTYSRDFNMMYLLINEQEVWVYYTRTNPATRVESWTLDYIEDIHSQHSQDATARSRCNSPWLAEGNRSPSPFPADTHSLGPSSLSAREACGRESLPSRKERVKILCLGMLYSPIIMASVEGDACPDATQFLMAGTQDGRVLFLHMFCKGLKFHQIQANKDAVLSVHHDQVMNTLVTKCRHPGIAVLIWSLPYLGLLKRVDCAADLTCYTRMNTLLLSGHESGYLHIHHLSADKCGRCEEMDDIVADARRAPPKDHQERVNSVDSNSTLEVFCSASQDGIVKLWDKEKTLLCEIALDDTLTVASFLNNQGDILVGFKQHIFVIPCTRVLVYPTREGLNNAYEADLLDDEAFETESDIYEDPSVRYESKKILQPDPTNMENYLVPFPNLLLKTSWFMEGRAPPDLNQQNQQDKEESLSLLSDTLSLAPTEVYCSPYATPRSMSLASVEAFSVRRGSVELWQLPAFGSSPVSTPPRTPPPEPTPPSTPPPDEESEEEDSEGETKEGEETQQESASQCVQCVDSTKKDTKKKISFVPSFRREGGRLGNISIDSRSLRSGGGGGGAPGYAAPVHRRVAEQRPEPKPFKPRRIPKAVVKKFKKPKEKEEEEAKKESDQEQQKNTETTEELPKKADTEFVDTKQETEISDHSSRNMNVLNIPSEEEKPVIRQDTVSAPLVLKTVSAPQGQANIPSTNGDENAHQKGAWRTQDAKPQQTTNDTTEETDAKHSSQIKHPRYTSRDESETQAPEDHSNNIQEKSDVTVKQDHKQVKPVKGSSPTPYGAPLVKYIDPDTGDIVQKPADEIPEGAEILEDYGNEEEIPEGEDKPTLSAQSLDSSLHKSIKSRNVRDGKSVRFTNSDKKSDLRIPSRQYRRIPEVYSSGRDSPLSRSYAFGVVPKEAVVPIYDRNSRKTSKSDLDVSPLTIFALARNRRQKFRTPNQTRSQSAPYPKRAPIKVESDIESSKTDAANFNDFDLNDDDFVRLIDRLDSPTADDNKGLAGSLRPPSVKKQSSSLTRWCIRALQKSDREVLFPPRPMRPKSSPITSNAKVTKDEGDTLFLNVNQPKSRPRTADTIRSTGTIHEEYSRFPYENTAKLDDVADERKSRDQKGASSVKVSSRKHPSPDEDEDLMDAYYAMRSSIGLHDVDEDYLKGIMPKGRGEYESVTDLPVVETNDYSGDWRSKVLERARLLKQRRLERQKSATERRQAKENEQKERWRTSSHFECTPESLPKSESSVEFITPPILTNVPSITTLPSQEETNIRSLKDHELATDRPYRLRMNFQSTGAGLSPAAKSLINLKSSDHHVSEIAHVLPKPPRSASIPSKCSRYVLVPQPLPKHDQPQATAMEQTLLLLRFPKSRVRRRHTSEAIPRPHSNPDVRLQTSFEL